MERQADEVRRLRGSATLPAPRQPPSRMDPPGLLQGADFLAQGFHLLGLLEDHVEAVRQLFPHGVGHGCLV